MGTTSFIAGMIVASMMPGHQPLPQSLHQIPLRCLAALEEGDDAYVSCRSASFWANEMDGECNSQSLGPWAYNACRKAAFECGIRWEIKFLREMAAQAEAQRK